MILITNRKLALFKMRYLSFGNSIRIISSLLVIVLVIYPFARLILGSLHIGGPLDSGPLTIENYRNAILGSHDLILNTLRFAIGQTLVPMVIGILLAWIVTRTDVPLRGLWEFSSVALYFIPILAAGTAWSILLGGRNGLLNEVIRSISPFQGFDVYSMSGMIFVQSLYLVPLVFLVVSSSLRAVNPEFEDAARSCGASPLSVLFRITLGVCRPAVLSAAVLCFVIGLGSMEIPLLFGFPAREYVFTTDIYSALKVRFPPEYGRASAMGVLLLGASLLILVIYFRLIRDRERFVTVGGKASRDTAMRLGKFRWVGFVACALFFFFTLILPFLAVLIGSLLPYIGKPSMAMLSKASLNNYRQLIDNPIIWRSVKNSFKLSIFGGIVVMLVGLLLAYIVVRWPGRWTRYIDYGASLPMMVPLTVLAMSLVYTYITLSFPGGFSPYGTLWIIGGAYVVYFLPVAVRQMTGPVSQLSVDLEHAGRISGASQIKVIIRIVIPILLPALLGGLLLAFITYMREFSASVLLVRSGTEVISTVMYSYYSNGRLPYVAAISVGLWSMVLIVMLIFRLVFKVKISF